MILGLIIGILFFRWMTKLYDKSMKHNMQVFGSYLYQIIEKANK